MKIVSILAWHLSPYAQAHYEMGEVVVVVEFGIAIEATTIALDDTATLTITNICQLKIMLYLHILQSVQLQTIFEVGLKELIS